MDWGASRWDPHDDWKGCVVLLYNVHMVRSPYFGSESTVPTCISANAPPANFINYRFFSISCLLAISKRFGLPELLQSACKIVIATANGQLHEIFDLRVKFGETRFLMESCSVTCQLSRAEIWDHSDVY